VSVRLHDSDTQVNTEVTTYRANAPSLADDRSARTRCRDDHIYRSVSYLHVGSWCEQKYTVDTGRLPNDNKNISVIIGTGSERC
jgi:hypothetical protein